MRLPKTNQKKKIQETKEASAAPTQSTKKTPENSVVNNIEKAKEQLINFLVYEQKQKKK